MRDFGRGYIVIWLRERDEESEQMNFRFGETEENSGTEGQTLNYLNYAEYPSTLTISTQSLRCSLDYRRFPVGIVV